MSPDALEADFAAILDGQAAPEDITAFLERTLPLMTDAESLAAGARALRARMIPVVAPANAIDVCGTGGDGAHTINISTAVAFVVAGAGVPVAKHGNRAMSSKCGAADVLEALGVNLTGDVPTLERCLREANLAFLFAQNHHPAMRHVAAARRAFGQRTIFNLLGPLSNPAGVTRQLLGVFAPEYLAPMAVALSLLGARRALIVHGHGGLDELSNAGANSIVELDGGTVRVSLINVSDAHLSATPNERLRGGAAPENAQALRGLLEDPAAQPDYAEAVLFNAAAALVAAGVCNELPDGSEIALASLRGGRALAALDALVRLTNEAPAKPQ
ncbi:MAG: anthranilate phosphoribosyltransferase [Hyphomonadaceae bacterium]|nr:anthranilate phosphoribosyltransferase [Hyphomonadaceae bacterium]